MKKKNPKPKIERKLKIERIKDILGTMGGKLHPGEPEEIHPKSKAKPRQTKDQNKKEKVSVKKVQKNSLKSKKKATVGKTKKAKVAPKKKQVLKMVQKPKKVNRKNQLAAVKRSSSGRFSKKEEKKIEADDSKKSVKAKFQARGTGGKFKKKTDQKHKISRETQIAAVKRGSDGRFHSKKEAVEEQVRKGKDAVIQKHEKKSEPQRETTGVLKRFMNILKGESQEKTGEIPKPEVPKEKSEAQKIFEKIKNERQIPKLSDIFAKKAGAEKGKISSLSNLIKRPPKGVMLKGNMSDLTRELDKEKSQTSKSAVMILNAQRRVHKIEEKRHELMNQVNEAKIEQTEAKRQIEVLEKEMLEVEGEIERFKVVRKGEQEKIKDLESTEKVLSEDIKRNSAGLKAIETRLRKTRDRLDELPDEISELQAKIQNNRADMTEHEKRLGILDHELIQAKKQLEWSISEKRIIAKEFDRLTEEKNNIEYAYHVYDKHDKLKQDREEQYAEILDLKKTIHERQIEIAEPIRQEKSIINQIDQQEKRYQSLKKDMERATSKQRELEMKFSVYSEIDDAVRKLEEAEKKIPEDHQQINLINEELKQLNEEAEQSKQNLKALVAKEKDLRRKLDEVLVEKSRLEKEISELGMDGGSPSGQLIIELPDTLREAIKRETERITKAQMTLKSISEKQALMSRKLELLEAQKQENMKIVKLREKQFIYIKKKIGSSTYSEKQRLSLKKEMDAVELEKKEIDFRMKGINDERKHLKARMFRLKLKTRKTKQEISKLEKQIERIQQKIESRGEKMRQTRELKRKLFTGNSSALSMLYPIKEKLDFFTDEKSKISAEIEQATRAHSKIEADLDGAEKLVEKTRKHVNSLEEEYVGLQNKIHNLDRDNNQHNTKKESLQREFVNEKENQTLIMAEPITFRQSIKTLKENQMELSKRKRAHQNSIRETEAKMKKLQKKNEQHLRRIKELTEKIVKIDQKVQNLLERHEDESAKIIKALDAKKEAEDQKEQHIQRQKLLQSEIDIIAKIYK